MNRSIRIAMVCPTWGDPWREEDVISARVASALACTAEVDVLIAGGSGPREEGEGALRLRRFSALETAPSRRGSLLRIILGPDERGHFGTCDCLDVIAPELAGEAPLVLQRELVRTEGSDAAELFVHLGTAGYDAVVFAGLRAASTVFGIDAVPSGTRVALLALARRSPMLAMPIYDAVLARAERILAITTGERRRLERRVADASRLVEIGFALRVHELAARSDPVAPSSEGLLPVVRDWTHGALHWRLRRLAIYLRPRHPDVRICLLGRGAERFAEQGWTVVRQDLSSSRVDLGRRMSRAIAMLEPEPDRLLAIEALEAMMYGTPVLARADSGAAREHAESGNGGLWYHSVAELGAAIERLQDGETRATLGEQGKRYALARYGDVDAFVDRVSRSVLGSDQAPLEAAPAIG